MHIRTAHEGNNDFVCEVCDARNFPHNCLPPHQEGNNGENFDLHNAANFDLDSILFGEDDELLDVIEESDDTNIQPVVQDQNQEQK